MTELRRCANCGHCETQHSNIQTADWFPINIPPGVCVAGTVNLTTGEYIMLPPNARNDIALAKKIKEAHDRRHTPVASEHAYVRSSIVSVMMARFFPGNYYCGCRKFVPKENA